jgi:hypothetical protein
MGRKPDIRRHNHLFSSVNSSHQHNRGNHSNARTNAVFVNIPHTLSPFDYRNLNSVSSLTRIDEV